MKRRIKKSQITIWIIVAIVLVGLLVLVFLLSGIKSINILKPGLPNPQEYIEKCSRDNSLGAIDIILSQGGYISPINYKLYKDDKIAYLCYNKNYYQSCINQEPLLIEHLKEEIKNYITGKIKDCFYSLEQEYEKRGYQVNKDSSPEINVELMPKQVNIELKNKFEVAKETTIRYENFKARLNSPIYDLAVIAQEITNQEAKFCYFEYLGFQLLYLSYSIKKIDLGGEVKIYQVKEKISNKQLNFAVRSCAMPAGM